MLATPTPPENGSAVPSVIGWMGVRLAFENGSGMPAAPAVIGSLRAVNPAVSPDIIRQLLLFDVKDATNILSGHFYKAAPAVTYTVVVPAGQSFVDIPLDNSGLTKAATISFSLSIDGKTKKTKLKIPPPAK